MGSLITGLLVKLVPAGIGTLWSQVKMYVFAALGLAIVTAVALAYMHYNNLVNQVVTLKADSATYKSAISTQKDTIKAATDTIAEWKTSQAELQAKVKEMTQVAQDAQAETRRLNDVFAKHDLEKLSIAKPELVEDAVNAGTSRVGKLLECASAVAGGDCGGQAGPPRGKAGAARP